METTTTLTKQQRHEVYKKALMLYNVDVVNGGNAYGLCAAIDLAGRSFGHWGEYAGYEYILSHVPELNKYKPINSNPYWFPTSDYKTRISILKACIKETA